MASPQFLRPPPPLTVAEIAALTKAELANSAHGGISISGVASLDEAGPHHLVFFDNLRYADALARCRAGACIVSIRFAGQVPENIVVLRARSPFLAFVEATRNFHRDTLRPDSGFAQSGVAPSAIVHPDARLEDDVTIDPLAVIGPGVEIGSGTIIGSGAVIGAGVRIGRNCSIGAGCTLQYALIGNHVILHPGCRIGQDGFGYIPSASGQVKVPQIGRVIIQHDVEIGANSTIDRGSVRDTVIGEGAKIDNQVQVGHNVTIGRHTVIAAQCGLAGSLTIGNNVVIGAKTGLNNHLEIGDGAMISAMAAVKDNIPPRARWGGIPAKPIKQWFRELVAVERLARSAKADTTGPGETAESAPDAGVAGQN